MINFDDLVKPGPAAKWLRSQTDTIERLKIDRMNEETLRRCQGNPATTDPRTGVDDAE